MTYDIIIKDALIIDGTGQKEYLGTIGINKKKITKITKHDKKDLNGNKIIDCQKKLVSTPGFIDMHSHSDLAMFMHKNSNFYKMSALCKISQGITTEIVGQDGYSAGPISDIEKEGYITHWKSLSGEILVDNWKWNEIQEYLEAVKSRKFPTKIETLIGHNTIRINVMGYESRDPTSSELKDMQELVRTGLRQGAKGLSFGLIYPPGIYAKEKELIALASVAAEENSIIVAHIRNESSKVFEAIDEYLKIHNTANVRTHISHLKICGAENLNRGDELKEIILNSQTDDQPVSFDIYPYDAGCTMLQAILPPWSHEGGPQMLVQRLKDKKTCLKMASEVFSEKQTEWDNFIGFSKGGLEGIVIASAPDSYKNIIGKSLSEIGHEKGYDPSNRNGKIETFIYICQLMANTNLAISMISFNQSMDNVEEFMALDNIMTIGTDGIVGPSPHPRLYGAFPKYINWSIYKKKPKNSLVQTIHNITEHAANILGLEDRGTLKEGNVADITIFEPKKIGSDASWLNPTTLSTGIEHVIVDGKIVY